MALNQASMTKAVWSGLGLAVLFAVVNGISTWALPNNQTNEDWTTSKVGGV